ncbi:glutaredoxin family protein [Candidatus Woesearchaeota archaeon]|nr:glutaredoxin family protein [Candidatus Woesearchaeota archaeon]
MVQPKIKIYTTPACIFCKKAKEFFKANKLTYTEIDVSVDEKAAKEMVKKSGQMGVPVISVNDGKKESLIVGFDEYTLRKALKL